MEKVPETKEEKMAKMLMQNPKFKKEIEDFCTCPLCKEIYYIPLKISKCGHTFCKQCLLCHIEGQINKEIILETYKKIENEEKEKSKSKEKKEDDLDEEQTKIPFMALMNKDLILEDILKCPLCGIEICKRNEQLKKYVKNNYLKEQFISMIYPKLTEIRKKEKLQFYDKIKSMDSQIVTDNFERILRLPNNYTVKLSFEKYNEINAEEEERMLDVDLSGSLVKADINISIEKLLLQLKLMVISSPVGKNYFYYPHYQFRLYLRGIRLNPIKTLRQELIRMNVKYINELTLHYCAAKC